MESTDFIDKLKIGLYIVARGKFSFVNIHLTQMLGLNNKTQLVGKSFWSVVHPDDIAGLPLDLTPPFPPEQIRFEDGILSSNEKRRDLRLIKKGGGIIWVKIEGRRTIYHGNPAYAGYIKDVTSIRKLAQKADKYRMVIDEVEDAVSEADLSGNLTFLNASGAKRFHNGLESINCDRIESYLRNNSWSYRAYMDDATSKFVKSAYCKVYRTGLPNKNIRYEIIKPNGRRLVVEDSVRLIRDHNEKAVGYRTVSRDISNRVAAEKKLTEQRIRLRAIFKSVTDAIITIDPDFKVIEANAAVQNICGADPETIIGKKFPDGIDCCSKSCVNILSQTLSQKTETQESTIECRRKSRRHQIITINGAPLLDSQGRFIGGVLILRDITHLKSLEHELLARHQFHNIVGKSRKMQEIYHLLRIFSDVETTVLVTGKSGTGKELVARALHYGGRRALKPFVTVNCSALAENLLESELFGHVKGAFTGAHSDRRGRFYAADGGTIMLDEIGDISPLIQLKLLRVIQEKEFERVGENKPNKIDVRIIACTNKNLRQRVKRGRFREDLYYRLKVMEINLPPLSQRVEDIPLLVDHFCRLFNNIFKKNIIGTSHDVLDRLMQYSWPGNVRELKHAIERAFVLCSGGIISLRQLPAEIINSPKRRSRKKIYRTPKKYIRNTESIVYALKQVKGNKSKAAKILGISRQTLYRRIEEFKIDWNDKGLGKK